MKGFYHIWAWRPSWSCDPDAMNKISGDLVYKSKKLFWGMTDFSDQFRKIIMRYQRIGYNLNVMRHSACLVIYQITVDGFDALFNCTPVDRPSDSMMARPKAIHFSWLGPEHSSVAWSTGT